MNPLHLRAGPALPKLPPVRRSARRAPALRRSAAQPDPVQPRSPGRRRWMALPLLLLSLMATGLPDRSWAASPVELARLELQRNPEGLLLNFDTRFDLPACGEGALQRGVSLS